MSASVVGARILQNLQCHGVITRCVRAVNVGVEDGHPGVGGEVGKRRGA